MNNVGLSLRRAVVSIVLGVAACSVVSGDRCCIPAGVAGEDLKRAVAVAYAPQCYIVEYLTANGVWEVLKLTDSDGTATGYIDRFSDVPLKFAPSNSEGPPDAVPLNVVDASWWTIESGRQYGVAHDLYNIFLSLEETVERKYNYPPGSVADAWFDNGIWSVGSGFIDGYKRSLWSPPKGFEGDVARIMMYMLTVYRDGMITFGGPGGAYVARDYYPGISAGAARQLITWHRNDPVDEIERCRNHEFAKWQGNVNPFVEHPELAEYLWGDKKGDAFTPSTNPSSPLKPCYRLSDKVIDLWHPAVPPDAVWYVDGKSVSGTCIIPVDIGAGMHELRFEAQEYVGKVMIEIKP